MVRNSDYCTPNVKSIFWYVASLSSSDSEGPLTHLTNVFRRDRTRRSSLPPSPSTQSRFRITSSSAILPLRFYACAVICWLVRLSVLIGP